MIGVKVKYHDENQPRIEQRMGSDWVDLHVAKLWEMKPFSFESSRFLEVPLVSDEPIQDHPKGWYLAANVDYLLSLGVSMMFPDMFEAYLLPRSSTYKYYGLVMTNSMGLIDHTFCGSGDYWIMPCRCHKPSFLPLYARVAQFRLQWRMPKLQFEETENLPRPNRGGYGSTGR